MDLIYTFIMSAVPLTEQRLAIPVGILHYNIRPIILVSIVSYLGSLIPVPFILLLFNKIFGWMKKYKIFNHINNIIENKLQKGSKKVEKYKELGLIIFVAIPLPGTGLWTGSAVASFLGLDFKKSFICTAFGGVISAIIITILSVTFPTLLGFTLK